MIRKLWLFMAVVVSAVFILSVPSITDASDTSVMINEEYWHYCELIGEEYDIAPSLLMAICWTESGNNPREYSEHGAQGLTQIIGRYSKDRMKKLKVTDLYDPYSNILVCADILHDFEEKGYDVGDALVAYNCGEYSKTFKKYHNSGRLTDYADKVLKREEMISDYKYGD